MMEQADILLSSAPLDPATLNKRLSAGTSTGAVATFTGLVRGKGALTALELQHHPVMTLTALNTIGAAAMARFDLTALLIAHRFGRMKIGEPIVHIATAAPHRRAALDAVSYTIDVLKTQAPFWKREWYGDTSRWIEPTAEDHGKAAQWLGAMT